LHDSALLRFPRRQADRARQDAAGMPDATQARARRTGGGRHRNHAAAVPRAGARACHHRRRLSHPLARTIPRQRRHGAIASCIPCASRRAIIPRRRKAAPPEEAMRQSPGLLTHMRRCCAAALIAAISSLGTLSPVRAQQPPNGAVLVTTIDGVIGVSATRQITQAIQRADELHATALVLRLDTPGGLVSSTREIIKA